MLANLQDLTYQFWSTYKQQVTESFKFSPHIASEEVQSRIEMVIFDCVTQVFTLGTLRLSLINSAKCAGFDAETGVNRLTSTSEKVLKHGKTIAHLLKILQISYNLLKNNTKATKREVFYMDKGLFINQEYSDRAIENACNLLEIPRNRLNIIGAGKGLVSGSIEYVESGINTVIGNRILKIPLDIDEISGIQTSAGFILIVEKETVLNRLVQEKLFEKVDCIAVTGCGFPDMLTREFVKRLVNEFSYMPIFILTDFDPKGFEILSTYTFGSAKMCGECDSLALPFAHWIGVHYGESFLPLPLSGKDRKIIEKLVKKDQFNAPPNGYQNTRFRIWRLQLEEMEKSGAKYEIESTWQGELSEYLMGKINEGNWI